MRFASGGITAQKNILQEYFSYRSELPQLREVAAYYFYEGCTATYTYSCSRLAYGMQYTLSIGVTVEFLQALGFRFLQKYLQE